VSQSQRLTQNCTAYQDSTFLRFCWQMIFLRIFLRREWGGFFFFFFFFSLTTGRYDKVYDSDISEFKFYEKLLENLNFHLAKVYKPTAEVCGMVLLQVQKKADTSPFEQLLKDKVTLQFTNTFNIINLLN
jgi:hypothetical protein